jgi:2-iminobutanoate/2-iminopropanoate deaminase
MTERTVVSTTDAPQAIGPYSQAIVAGDMVFCSGQIPLDPQNGQLIEGGIEEQTRRVLDNLRAVLQAAGSSLDRVVKTTIFLADMNDFSIVNMIYAEYFGNEPPARSTVQVARLPRDVQVEVEAIALKEIGDREITDEQ